MEYGSIFIKLIAGFARLWAMTRLLGNKEISALTPFDFISAVILGDLAGNTIYEKEHSVLMLLFTLAVWTVLSITFEKVTQQESGEIQHPVLKSLAKDEQWLLQELLKKDYPALDAVAYAELNEEGELSVIAAVRHHTMPGEF